jgi:phosphoglucosamine mutase
MRSLGCNLGGEQSGHIILSNYATTGDGLIAALQVLAAIVETGRRASEVCRVFAPVPQLLRNLRYSDGKPLDSPNVQHAIAAAEARLGSGGRLVIRNSGTEPVIRVMAESEDEALLKSVVDDVCAAILAAAQNTEAVGSYAAARNVVPVRPVRPRISHKMGKTGDATGLH